MEENYSAQQVIEALASVGVPQQVIELVVPIAAYESRVDGVPFVHEAADKLSPSYGVFQINVDSEPAFYYQVMKDAGFNLEGLFTEEQIKQLETNIVGENDKDVRDFSDEAQAKAKTFMAKTDLKTQAQLFKLVYDNKAKELDTDEPMKILSNMYSMTVDKYNDSENEDAQELKGKIEGDVSDYFASKQKIKDDTSLFKQAEEDSMDIDKKRNDLMTMAVGKYFDNNKNYRYEGSRGPVVISGFDLNDQSPEGPGAEEFKMMSNDEINEQYQKRILDYVPINNVESKDAPNSFFPQRPTPAKNYFALLRQLSKVENANK